MNHIINMIWNTIAKATANISASNIKERITIVITIGGINNIYQPSLFLIISATINTAQNTQVNITHIHINVDIITSLLILKLIDYENQKPLNQILKQLILFNVVIISHNFPIYNTFL